MQTHRIRIMGRDLQVRSAASPEQVREVEELINGKVLEAEPLVKGGDTQLTAILVMLNLAETYLDLVRRQEARQAEENEKILKLLRRVETAS